MAASAIDDSVASLNIESDNLYTNRSNAKILESDMQPTRKSTIQSLLAMETQASDFVVSPTAGVGTVFYQTPVTPIGLNSNVTTRVEWISRMFRFWSGDLKVKVVFTKTILQQTKLICVFVPGAIFSDTPPTVSEAYFYSHKMIMNPTNETKLTMVIPFVSDRPVLTTSSSTGMFYIMMYQPLVNSFDSSNPVNIYGKIFVSADFDLHETIPLPALKYSPMLLPTSLLWVTSATTSTVVTPTSGGTGNALVTDSGNNAAVYSQAVPVYTHIAYAKFKPILISNILVPDSPYNSSRCRTLFGSPMAAQLGTSRRVLFAAAASVADAATTVYVLDVVATEDSIWLAPSYSSNGALPPVIEACYKIVDGVYNLSGTYNSLFTTAFAFPESFNFDAMIDAFTTRM